MAPSPNTSTPQPPGSPFWFLLSNYKRNGYERCEAFLRCRSAPSAMGSLTCFLIALSLFTWRVPRPILFRGRCAKTRDATPYCSSRTSVTATAAAPTPGRSTRLFPRRSGFPRPRSATATTAWRTTCSRGSATWSMSPITCPTSFAKRESFAAHAEYGFLPWKFRLIGTTCTETAGRGWNERCGNHCSYRPVRNT